MLRWLLVVFLLTTVCGRSSLAQTNYRLPPQKVVDIIDSTPPPGLDISNDGSWILLMDRDAMPSIEDQSRRMLRLAGMRIDPAANGRFRSSYSKAIQLRRHDTDQVTQIPVPPGARIGTTSWSHDSKSFVYTIVTDNGTQLWGVQVDSPQQPRLLTERLSTVMGGLDWLPDGRHLLCWLVPADRGAEPTMPTVPSGPNIQESSGNTSPTRTYQDLLTSPADEALLEYYATSQLAIVGWDGAVQPIGQPDLIVDASPSPNGELFLVTRLQKPFSYLMPYSMFPQLIQVWDRQGRVVHQVADVPLAENIPIEGVRTGPRQVQWKPSEPASLVWVEALDGGDPRQEADHRDLWTRQAAPFKNAAQPLLKVQHRAYGLTFFRNPSRIITHEYDRDRRWIRALLHDLSNSDSSPKVITDRSIRDRYGDAGSIVTAYDEDGKAVVRMNGPSCFRVGGGASPVGMLPFVDRQNLETLETERLWRCEEGAYERAVEILDGRQDQPPSLITIHQTPTSPPNLWMRNLAKNSVEPITHFPDPTPQIRGVRKELVKYERKDGVPLSATLYLPADHQEGQRLPLIVWAYPLEFNDASTAGQISSSPWLFTRMQGATHLTLLTQGYAIMHAATMPVIGDPETMNDTFIEQIVASAEAAIDKAVEMGVADPNRVGVGGHSYGAFMTANLLAHCDRFRAGVARSGAYNRTLTPFGFQSERRPLWEAKSVYFEISPFMFADRIKEPLLLIHGEEDNNSGTFPIQSQRMFQAVKGNGGTVRLVMLPKESHGYRARESVLHVQAEMIDWFNLHVRDATPQEAAEANAGEAAGR